MKILSLLIWFGLFWFITGKLNPMDWSGIARAFFVLISLVLISKD
jgi:hypothetical protein